MRVDRAGPGCYAPPMKDRISHHGGIRVGRAGIKESAKLPRRRQSQKSAEVIPQLENEGGDRDSEENGGAFCMAFRPSLVLNLI